MLRYVTLCTTLVALLLTALAPLQAQSASGCASSPSVAETDVCLAPGVTPSPRVPAKNPCFNCALPSVAALPGRPGTMAPMQVFTDAPLAPGRVIRPDRKPPRA
ncbi:hypothetical protein KUV28_02065 [Ferrimonas balearica]|nr:hypothetical protein [Ferrimonas balearica]